MCKKEISVSTEKYILFTQQNVFAVTASSNVCFKPKYENQKVQFGKYLAILQRV